MTRLDTERQNRLEPKRIEYAIQQIQKLGFEVNKVSDHEINFQYKGHIIKFFPYSGWATGSTIKVSTTNRGNSDWLIARFR